MGRTDPLCGGWQGWILTTDYIERSIRPFVIGRKNWLFSDTPSGADASALWYSLIETAKANGVEPFHYILKVIKGIPHAKNLGGLPEAVTLQR